MIAALTNHLWQSTVFVTAAWLVTLALRKNGAHVRHAIWTIASLKFLVPFSLLIALGQWLPSPAAIAPAAADATTPDFAVTVDLIAQPFAGDALARTSASTAKPAANSAWMIAALIVVWGGGLVVISALRLRGWWRVRAALRASTALPLLTPIPVRSSPGLLEPGVVGIWRPVMLLPQGIEQRLTPQQLQAVVEHELCHVRRRDNLTAALHMLVEGAFWFHPLVWWVGARLVDERERACDEHVLSVCGEPQTYAESIVNVCKFYTESPLACVSGVTGSDLKRRIAAIMVNRVGLRLNLARRAALTIAAVLAIILPLVAGILTAPLRALAESQTAKEIPKFDVVSVKPCEPNAPGQMRGDSGNPITSPGRLYLQCYRLSSLIPEAYLYFADGRAHGLSSLLNVGVEGGPDWMKSERFLIEARTGQAVAPAVMRGPMLQAILEDRFKLKTRRVTRELPIYELVAAKSGAKVAPYAGNECVIKDDAAWPPPVLPAGQRYCGDRSRSEGDRFIREGVLSLDELVSLLSSGFDRPIVNKTGITAPVSYRFEYPLETAPDARQAVVVAALKNQLGLEIRTAKGPRDFLVIDHVERPAPNDPAVAGDAAFASATASSRVPKAGPFVPDVAREQATAAPGPSAPRFDPVTIKPCSQPRPSSGGTPAPAGGRSGGAPWQAQTSPGYVHWGCVTLAQLVEQAYADQDHPLLNSIERPRRDSLQPKRVRGGPSWTESEMFTIEARTSLEVTSSGLDGSVTRSLARLPATMSQALRATLEDRFQLKVRRATEPQDMYALTIAKSGIKTDKLAVTKPGDCRTRAQYAASAPPPMTLDTPNPKICGLVFFSLNAGPEFSGFTLQQLAAYISPILDRFVLNQTGDDRPFNFAFRRAADYGGAGGSGWIISALDELGLKLDATRGPIEYLVIDRVERPRPD